MAPPDHFFEPAHSAPDGASVAMTIHVRGDHVLVRRTDGGFPADRRTDHGVEHHLGLLQGESVIGVDLTDVEVEVDVEDDEHEWAHLRNTFDPLGEHLWALAGRATQIATWDRNHRFCGRCGTETELVGHERSRQCPNCGLIAYPRLSPAVIMLIEKGDKVLLAHGVQFPRPFYSALAGFVEPGETLEQTVIREVREEVGIEIDDVTYFGSQPWPFPHQVMIGFFARWVSGEIDPDPTEIVDAGWFGRDELPMVPPRGISIAGELLHAWRTRSR